MKKVKKNNSGMALVSVIVVIGFIAALVSIVLTTTLVNFKMRSVNERSKDTFYSAEQALDEINIGLQRFMSDSMSEAYIEVLESNSEYSVTDTMSETQKEEIKKKRNELLRVRFYEGMWTKLGYADHRDQYDVEILDAFLKDSTRWHGDEEDGYGAILLATDADDSTTESKVGKMITYEEEGIVLKDLKVYYKDAAGFVSVIKTDIRMDYPGFSFERSTEVPDIVYYSFIADVQADLYGNIETQGNIYANQFTVNGGTIKTSAGDDITIKYDLDLKSGSSFITNENTVLWAKNIVADSAQVDLKGDINVANDVNLKGRDSSLVVTGTYTGFGNSTDNSYKSSSILLNGVNSSIDVSKTSSFVLGGHTFAATSKSKKLVDATKNNDVRYSENSRVRLAATENADVFMAESIAPKYNQMLYLVPAYAIGVNKETGESRYHKNPLTMKEYTAIITGKDENQQDIGEHVEIATDVELDELAGSDLSSFVQTENGDDIRVNRVFVRTSDEASTGGGLVYYYMDFGQDEAKARDYFSLYYSNKQESADKFMDFYINQILVPDPSVSNLNIAGTYFTGSNGDDGFKENFGNSLSSSVKMSNICDDEMALYLKKVKCSDSDVLDTFELDQADAVTHHQYFDKIIATSNFTNFTADCMSASAEPLNGCSFEKSGNKIYVINGDSERVAILCNDNDEITDSDLAGGKVCLIITKGNVTISNNYSGLIISDGIVKFNNGVSKVNADPSAVKEVLNLGFVNNDTHEKMYITKIIKASSDFGGKADDDDNASKTLGEMISYENWTKY